MTNKTSAAIFAKKTLEEISRICDPMTGPKSQQHTDAVLKLASEALKTLDTEPNVRFLAIGAAKTGGGYFGHGTTKDEAISQLRKAGFRGRADGNRTKVFRFRSYLPFAPRDRDATEGEADFWIDGLGIVYWANCEKDEV